VVREGNKTPLLPTRLFLVDWEEAVLVITGLELEELVLPILGLVVVGVGVRAIGLEEMVGLDWWSYHTLYRLLNRIQ
jgi:hypothetical protein